MSAINFNGCEFRYPGGVGYKVYFFQLGGTTTPISSYADYGMVGQNAWPVVLADDGSGDGFAKIYLAQSATIVLKNVYDVTIEGFPADWVRPASSVELGLLQDAVEASNDAQDASILALQAADGLLDGRLDSAEADITTLEGRATAVEGRATSLESRATAVEGRATSLEGRATSLEGRATSLEGRATSLEGRATSLEGSRTTDEAAIATLQGQVITLQEQVAALLSLEIEVTTGTSNSWYDPITDTLLQWGSFSTDGSGNATVTFPIAYSVTPVTMLATIWSGSAAIAAKLKTESTTGFTAYAFRVDSEGQHGDTIGCRYNSIGKKT